MIFVEFLTHPTVLIGMAGIVLTCLASAWHVYDVVWRRVYGTVEVQGLRLLFDRQSWQAYETSHRFRSLIDDRLPLLLVEPEFQRLRRLAADTPPVVHLRCVKHVQPIRPNPSVPLDRHSGTVEPNKLFGILLIGWELRYKRRLEVDPDGSWVVAHELVQHAVPAAFSGRLPSNLDETPRTREIEEDMVAPLRDFPPWRPIAEKHHAE